MKQRIILKETDLYNIIKETINRILKEEYSSNSNEGLTFYLPKSDTTQISHFLKKLANVNEKSKKSNCGNIGVNTETVTKRVGDENIPYLKITVTPSAPQIKINGYKYIGTITPMKLIINGENKEHMMVALSEEFYGNDYYKNILKQSSQIMKCDGCNRERARGIYCCFLEEKTGKILKLGSSCASNYFGIDVASKLNNLFSALSNLGNEPYLQVFNDEIIGKYTDPVLSDLYSVLNDTEHERLNNAILKGCWAIAQHGANCPMKTSMGDAEIYFSIVKACIEKSRYYNGKVDEQLFESLMKDEEKENSTIFQERDQARELMVDFLTGSLDTFYNMEPQNDFESKVQDVGLLITGGAIQKKTLTIIKLYKYYTVLCTGIF